MKILVVDDDNNVRLFMQRLLTKKFPCEVLEARNGLEGLSLVQNESPNLVLLDVKMPIIDGVEMLEAIRSDPSHATLPVIVMSAVGDSAQVARLIMLGISGYILKPLWSETVYERVYDVISKVKTSRQYETKTKIDIGQGDRQKVLVVDKDLNFRTFFNSVLGGRFEIYDVETGTEGLELFAVHNPHIVCLGEGLTLLNERLLARKIRQVDKNRQAGVFLCAEGYRTNNND